MGLLGLALCCAVLVGCGARAQVSGKVLYEDGSPVSKGKVSGESEDGIRISAPIGADGAYSLYELAPGDGVPAGKTYKLWITGVNEVKPSGEKMRDPDLGTVDVMVTIPLIHSDFTSPQFTKLTLKVPGGGSIDHEIKVKKP